MWEGERETDRETGREGERERVDPTLKCTKTIKVFFVKVLLENEDKNKRVMDHHLEKRPFSCSPIFFCFTSFSVIPEYLSFESFNMLDQIKFVHSASNNVKR